MILTTMINDDELTYLLSEGPYEVFHLMSQSCLLNSINTGFLYSLQIKNVRGT